MKHKRQTLSKEDGDDKDGASSDGQEKSKSDKFGLDDDDKKACHNCDITTVGDVGSTLSGDVTELTSVRGSSNNNNTPSATNNNNSSGFNNANSNGTSSVGSTNSVSSTFDKMMVDEDSHSHDGSDVTSPGLTSKKLDVRIKLESEHKSPSSAKQSQISISKKSPSSSGVKDMCSVSSNGVLLALPDSTVGTPTLPNPNSSTRSLTPSSTPSTPASVQLQGSPLSSVQQQQAHYMQRPRSSPSSSTTATSNVASLHGANPTSSISPHARAQSHYQQQQNVYLQTASGIDYRNGIQTGGRQSNVYSRDQGYHHQQHQRMGAYAAEMQYPQPTSSSRQSQMRSGSHHGRTRSMYSHHVSVPQQQQQQYHQQYASTGDYNGYPNVQSATYHASYHAR